MFNSLQASISSDAPVKEVRTKKRTRRRRKAKSQSAKGEGNKGGTKSKVSLVESKNVTSASTKKHHDAPMTKKDLYFALDCEMVGVGMDGLDSAVGRVTIVNWEQEVVLDTFVQVPVPVTDYRTYVSGILPEDIEPGSAAISFSEVREIVQAILLGKILIGHGLENDLKALGLSHPWCDIRDTATYPYFMREGMHPMSGEPLLVPRRLRDLVWEELRRSIQVPNAPHSPVEDALAALDLYKSVRSQWEESLVKVAQQERQQQLELAFDGQNRRWQFFAQSDSTQSVQHIHHQGAGMFHYPSQNSATLMQETVSLDGSLASSYTMESQEPPPSWFRFAPRRPKVFNRVSARSIDETVSTQPSVDSIETEIQDSQCFSVSLQPCREDNGDCSFLSVETVHQKQDIEVQEYETTDLEADFFHKRKDALDDRASSVSVPAHDGESDEDPEIASYHCQEFNGYEPPRYFSPVDPEPTPKSTWFSMFRPKGVSPSASPPPLEGVPSSESSPSDSSRRMSRRASESAAIDQDKYSSSFFRRWSIALKSNSSLDDGYFEKEDRHAHSLH